MNEYITLRKLFEENIFIINCENSGNNLFAFSSLASMQESRFVNLREFISVNGICVYVCGCGVVGDPNPKPY